MPPLVKPDCIALKRRARLRLVLRQACYVNAGLACLVLVVAGACYLRLFAGPLSLDGHSARIAQALSARLGPGWSVTLSGASIELQNGRPAIRTDGIEIRNPAGHAILQAPYALVSVDPVSMLSGGFAPHAVELRDLQVRGIIGRDGSLSFEPQSPSPEPNGAPSPQDRAAQDRKEASRPASPQQGSPLAAAIASLLDPIVQPGGLIGPLNRASVAGARLTLVDDEGRERATYRVDAAFDRMLDGGRRIDIDLEGANGPWYVDGTVAGGDRRAELEISSVPVMDLMRLSGLSRSPVESDLRLTATMSAVFTDGRLAGLDGRFTSTAGTLTRLGQPTIPIDKLAGAVSWSEADRALKLAGFEIASQGTRATFGGMLAPDPKGWRLTLSGRNAGVAGLTDRDPAFAIAEFGADLLFGLPGIVLERGFMTGDALDIRMSGALWPGEAGPTGRSLLDITRTDARRMVRLWPDMLNPGLRSFLAQRLDAGTVEGLRLTSVLDARDFAAVFSDAPLSDGALALEFAAAGVQLSPVDGLPPVRGLAVDAKASGTRVALQAKDGRITMSDGRALGFTDASFVHAHTDQPGSSAQIGFRITGGLDGLAAFLKSPAIGGASQFAVDPATLRGRVDIRASLPIVPGRLAALPDLALSASGTLSDVQADDLPGHEKLEGGNVTLNYEAGQLTARGDGKLAGSPATFELRAARGGAADMAVALTLDEALRTRRNLPVAPQLGGPVPLKITADLTPGAKPHARFEADLSRASIDGLVPGWTKPANRPGKLSFTLGDGEAFELRDLVVDAGSVQIRGQVGLAASGTPDKADLSTFKLSPGDDFKVQFERAPGNGPYRVTVKGNNADARPFMKWAGSGTAAGKAPGREPPELEIDLALNILTGHNDEAMTGVTAKGSGRGGDLRNLQFMGRVRTATVQVQLGKRDAGSPVLNIRSGDAGATLRFVDLYRRMIGGRLALDGRSDTGVQEGRLTIEEFGLRGEPALKSIVSQASPAQQQGIGDERGMAPVARSDVDKIFFTRLTADFRRAASRVDLSDVVIFGAQVGFNLSGSVDFVRDRLDISGTFVPAYMLNNAFGQLPVVGILLGGRNEGLFAVDFRVAGTLANPALTVNPLTAVAPGILRKLFGWMLPGGETPPATGTVPRRSTE